MMMMKSHLWAIRVVCCAGALSLAACGYERVDPEEGGENSTTNPSGGGKGDTTVEPIASLSCAPAANFVEVGGFVEIEVDAKDADGRVSRNYTVEVSPMNNARVVQRNKIIFDDPGAYDVKCISNDSPLQDATSVMVGYTEPALTVDAKRFVTRDRVRITGRAVAAEDAPLFVEVDGYVTELGEGGTFDVTMPADVGELNRFEVVATDNRGRSSDRNVWVVVGEFGDLQEPTQDAVRVSLGPEVYPQLASLVERVLQGLPEGQTEKSDGIEFQDLLSKETGENLGINWEFDPLSVGSTVPNVTLTPEGNGIRVDVVLDTVFIDAIVRTGDPGDQKERTLRGEATNLVVTATLRVNGPDDLGIQDVAVEWDDLDVDISDFPNWIVDLFVYFLDDKFKNMMRDGIEKGGNKALVGALDGFGVEKQFDLPEPLETTMTTTSTVSTLAASTNGLDVGLSFGIDGETDPLRADAPGPLRYSERTTDFTTYDSYQVALALEPINDLLFAAWQTGSLDITIQEDQGIETTDAAPQVYEVIAFVEPMLPPVLVPTGTPGEFRIEIGEVRADAVFDTSLGMANVAAVLGAAGTVRLSGTGTGFGSEVALESLYVDVLVAPFSLEREAAEALIEQLLIPKLMADFSSVISNFPIPEADLSGLDVGLSTLSVENVRITENAPGAALSVRTDLVVR